MPVEHIEIQDYWEHFVELKKQLSEGPFEQTLAPCLGGIANFEKRRIGPGYFQEGPEWIIGGKTESTKDLYVLKQMPISFDGDVFKYYECVERCVHSNAIRKAQEPYLNQASVEHLLIMFMRIEFGFDEYE